MLTMSQAIDKSILQQAILKAQEFGIDKNEFNYFSENLYNIDNAKIVKQRQNLDSYEQLNNNSLTYLLSQESKLPLQFIVLSQAMTDNSESLQRWVAIRGSEDGKRYQTWVLALTIVDNNPKLVQEVNALGNTSLGKWLFKYKTKQTNFYIHSQKHLRMRCHNFLYRKEIKKANIYIFECFLKNIKLNSGK